jgi:hypothetical protein
MQRAASKVIRGDLPGASARAFVNPAHGADVDAPGLMDER